MKTMAVVISLLICSILALGLSSGKSSLHITEFLLDSATRGSQQPQPDSFVSSGTRRSGRAQEAAADFHASVVRNGIVLDVATRPVPGSREDSFVAGDDLRISLRIHDAETGSPLTGLHPSAWMSLLSDNPDVPCKTAVKSFQSGSLIGRPPDVDMNAQYVAALNRDGTITIVDPQFSTGRSRLISLITLKGRGEDWALNSNQTRLYVAMPQANEVAAIDTAGWRISHNMQISHPGRLALQPDGHYLWVSYEGEPSGVAVVRASDLMLVKRIALGKGPHDIAFSNDSRFAFATSRDAHSVAVIDVGRLTQMKQVRIDGQPFRIAFSSIAQAAYVSDRENGLISAIGTNGQEIVSRIRAEPGLTQISFPGEGRLGFVLNPSKGKVHILDTARNEIVQTADIDNTPTQISFSDQFAYVMRQRSEVISMLPLDALGRPNTPVPVIDLPASEGPAPEPLTDRFTTLVSKVPGENSVVIANPKDKAIYYYYEGMAAPMGIYGNFGREPGAVLVIDRALRETAPGVYEGVARLGRRGSFTLAVAVATPPLVECFRVPVGRTEIRSNH